MGTNGAGAASADGDSGGSSGGDEPRRAVEALLLVATEPLTAAGLAAVLDVGAPDVEAICTTLAADYEDHRRGFALVRVAGGWRLETHPDLAPYVERFALEGRSARLSGAALETLAIVAYRQPVSRAQLAAIRGVGVDGVLGTLVKRGYVEEVGRDPGPGSAVLYGTSQTFLERLGLDSLDDLPPLGPFVPDAETADALEEGLRQR